MKKSVISFLCALVLFTAPLSAGAVRPELDTGRRGSITLHYVDGAEAFAGLEIQAYRVAAVTADGGFALVAPFASYPVSVNNVQSQTEWRNTANTLASYIIADKPAATCAVETDSNGTAFMPDMETGLYLVLATKGEKGGTVYSFENFFVVLPRPTEAGYDYDTEAVPKKDKYTGCLEYRVTKLWQDGQNPAARPQAVDVDLYRNGEYVETQTLNGENNWTYSWQDIDGTGSWTVAEKNVPAGYTVTVTQGTIQAL